VKGGDEKPVVFLSSQSIIGNDNRMLFGLSYIITASKR